MVLKEPMVRLAGTIYIPPISLPDAEITTNPSPVPPWRRKILGIGLTEGLVCRDWYTLGEAQPVRIRYFDLYRELLMARCSSYDVDIAVLGIDGVAHGLVTILQTQRCRTATLSGRSLF